MKGLMMSATSIRGCLLSLVLFSQPFVAWTPAAIAQATSGARQINASSDAIFMVSKGADAENGWIEPVVLVDGRGRLGNPVSGQSDAGDLSQFKSAYFRKGQKHRLIFGGGDAGSVLVKQPSEGECLPASADVELQTTAKIAGNVTALASSSAKLGTGKSWRRAPTDAERASMLALVRSIFRRRGVSAPALRSMTTVNLTATDINRDDRAELIGTFGVTSGRQVKDTLFIIAELQGRNYRATLTNYDRIRASQIMNPEVIDEVGKSPLLTELLIDQLDLDGNGVAEVFTAAQSFEGMHFNIYRKQAGRWKSVYEFYSYRCGY